MLEKTINGSELVLKISRPLALPVIFGHGSHVEVLNDVEQQMLEYGCKIVVLDCQSTVFTTSGFGRFLVSLNKRVKAAGCRMRLINVSKHMQDVLNTLSFDALFEVCADGLELSNTDLDFKDNTNVKGV